MSNHQSNTLLSDLSWFGTIVEETADPNGMMDRFIDLFCHADDWEDVSDICLDMFTFLKRGEIGALPRFDKGHLLPIALDCLAEQFALLDQAMRRRPFERERALFHLLASAGAVFAAGLEDD